MRTDAEAQQLGLKLEQTNWLDDELRNRDLARTKGCDPAHTNQAPVSDASRAPTRTHESGQHNRLKLPTSQGSRAKTAKGIHLRTLVCCLVPNVSSWIRHYRLQVMSPTFRRAHSLVTWMNLIQG